MPAAATLVGFVSPREEADARHRQELDRTKSLPPQAGVRVRHPLNPKSEVVIHRLSDAAGMKRAHMSLARIPPGRESFLPHAHRIEEEFLFILEGQGTATVGEETFAVGPGDYLGFPTDGTAHHLLNTGSGDLVYLMGGERAETEVADFPSIGKIGVFSGGHSHFYDEEPTIKLAPKDWTGAK